jgi:hypothetical protein
MHLVSSLPGSRLTEFSEQFASVALPTHIPHLYGPKLISRPADLSPGEYETLVHTYMPLLVFSPSGGLGDAEVQRWVNLYRALQKLWNA